MATGFVKHSLPGPTMLWSNFSPPRVVSEVNTRIALQRYSGRRRNPGGFGGQKLGESEVQQDFKRDRLIYKCRLDPSVDNSGYAGVVRVVRNGGYGADGGRHAGHRDASSVMLITRIEWFADYSDDKVEALRQAVEQLSPDYDAILERHRKVQSEALNRVTVDFGGAAQYGMSTEELLDDQRSRRGYSPALLEKIFQMGRYWFILTSGKYPTMVAETNANINLQIAPGPQGDLREGMDAYFNWMESLAPDFRVNAKNIFGMRGTHYSLCPATECRSLVSLLLRRLDRRDLAPSLLAFRRRLVSAPVLGSLSGDGDVKFLRNRDRAGI